VIDRMHSKAWIIAGLAMLASACSTRPRENYVDQLLGDATFQAIPFEDYQLRDVTIDLDISHTPSGECKVAIYAIGSRHSAQFIHVTSARVRQKNGKTINLLDRSVIFPFMEWPTNRIQHTPRISVRQGVEEHYREAAKLSKLTAAETKPVAPDNEWEDWDEGEPHPSLKDIVAFISDQAFECSSESGAEFQVEISGFVKTGGELVPFTNRRTFIKKSIDFTSKVND